MRRSQLAHLTFGVTTFDGIFGFVTFELFFLSIERTFSHHFKTIYESVNKVGKEFVLGLISKHFEIVPIPYPPLPHRNLTEEVQLKHCIWLEQKESNINDNENASKGINLSTMK